MKAALIEGALLLVYIAVGVGWKDSASWSITPAGNLMVVQNWVMWVFLFAITILIGTLLRGGGRQSY